MNRRKGRSVILSAILVLALGMSGSYGETAGTESSASQGAAAAGAFTDIGGHWAESIIKEAASLKIVGGYTDGTYLPDNLIKREEFYKLLTNILTEKPDTANTKIQFSDVVDYEWYVPTIKTAVAAGITSGYGDGTFGIGLMISRQEAAKVAGSVIPAYGVEDEEGVEQALDKGQVADWAYPYVDLMFKKGYMKGDSEGNFRPTTALTRAEAATILLNVKKNEPVITANAGELALTDCMEVHDGQEGVFVRGSGTKNDPYEITTEQQLNHLRMHTDEDAYYVLTKNIAITKDYAVTPPAVASGEPDWTEGNFVPIGTKEDPFEGSLDGNGYTVSGLNIEGTVGKGSSKTVASYAGLFGYLAEDASITDLIIDASNITGNQYTGAVAGYNEGTVKDCQLGKKGVVNGKTYTGGLVGYSTQALTSLRNMGEVTGTGANTGGIVGYISAPGTALQYCQNEGTVEGNEKTGGVVGTAMSNLETSSIIEECYNKGEVQSESYNAGGIAGFAGGDRNKITITDCGNSGEIDGTGINGGIVGLTDSMKVSIIKCKNLGTVKGSGAGGIAGSNRGEISYCYNSGTVKADLYGGGIAAYQEEGKGRVTKCYNEGNVSATSNGGGIVGENGSRIDNSYHSGKVSGDNYIGGIAGKNKGTVTNSYCSGNVAGKNGAGALIGRNQGSLNNSFWLETVGSSAVGLLESSDGLENVKKVSLEELSGQMKIKTISGYKLLTDVMNSNITSTEHTSEIVWQYLYTVVESGDAVISDGGGIVPPIDNSSFESKGNIIKAEDLNTKYLYPSILIQ